MYFHDNDGRNDVVLRHYYYDVTIIRHNYIAHEWNFVQCTSLGMFLRQFSHACWDTLNTLTWLLMHCEMMAPLPGLIQTQAHVQACTLDVDWA